MTLPGKDHFDPLLLERAANIRLLVLDVDGVMTDGRLSYDQFGNELKTFSTRDGFGIRCVIKAGIQLAIITGRKSLMVERRARELGIEFVYQGQSDKLEAFNSLLQDVDVEPAQVCYAGDDWPDIPVLARVGLAVTVDDADELVKTRAHWVTSRVGGDGAVRELCDLILIAQDHYASLADDYLQQ